MNKPVCLIRSRWHDDLVGRCVSGFLDGLGSEAAAKVVQVEVAGALEIPLHAQLAANRGTFSAVACVALVVDGGIYQHEYVAGAVLNGMMRVQLDTGVPVLSAVLSPRHFHEHDDHIEFFTGHLYKKGLELAESVKLTEKSLAQLR